MPRRLALFLLLLCGAAVGAEWKAVYLHDEDDAALSIHELKFASAATGMALGVLDDKNGRRVVSVRTSDGGATWKLAPLSPRGLSLFFLNERAGWMAAADGVYFSSDAGLTWKRRWKGKNVLRLWFVDERRGFAAGAGKTVLETSDGGAVWTPLAVSAAITSDPERTAFTAIDFGAGKSGFITGSYIPRRREEDREFPDWMEPEKATARRQWPSTAITLQTLDGGATWKASKSAVFGRLSVIRSSGGRGLSLLEFDQSFDWPSEVFAIDFGSGKTTRSFREKDRAVTDTGFLAGGEGVLAAVETLGQLRRSPVPGPVKMLVSRDLIRWDEEPVDYRAVAHKVILALSPGGAAWVATDTGMILRRVPEGR